MDEQVEAKIRDLLTKAEQRFSEARAHQIGFAAIYAAKAHGEQKRKDGDPFIMHPLRVAERLLDCKDSRIDDVTIIAALLHDVVEDTNKTLDTIHMQFGRDVANIVDALTKPMEGNQQQRDKNFVEQIRAASKKDSRVGIIKLSDQIDNSQDMSVYAKKRRDYRLQSLKEVWIPLAKDLELPMFEQELEQAYQKHQE